jgi:YegS/Rv2252/BmrU family lipid kinase
MNQVDPDRFLIIINPKAGRKDSSYLVDRIKAIFAGAPGQPVCDVVLTDRPGHATELSAHYARQYGGHAVVIACGGDGTAREVANGIARTPAAMAILPTGTANDFARAVYTTCQLGELLPRLPYPDIRPIDVIDVDGEICLNIASLGFDTKVQRKAQQINARCRYLGSFVYPLAIMLSLFGKREYPMRYELVAVDDEGRTETIRGDARLILAAICNGRYYGGGFNPAPAAKPDDGLLNFCLVDSMPLLKMLAMIPRYKKGTHLGDPAVYSRIVRSGTIQATEGLLLGNFDGESFTRGQITFQIQPRALRFAFY